MHFHLIVKKEALKYTSIWLLSMNVSETTGSSQTFFSGFVLQTITHLFWQVSGSQFCSIVFSKWCLEVAEGSDRNQHGSGLEIHRQNSLSFHGLLHEAWSKTVTSLSLQVAPTHFQINLQKHHTLSGLLIWPSSTIQLSRVCSYFAICMKCVPQGSLFY